MERDAISHQAGRVFRGVRSKQRGQAVVEFALTVPLFLMLLLASIEFGLLINGHMVLANAVREGARAAALGQQINTVNSRIISQSGTLTVTGSNIKVESSTDDGKTWTVMTTPSPGASGSVPQYNSAATGSLIRVTVEVSYTQLTNFVPGLNGTKIGKTVVMRREPT